MSFGRRGFSPQERGFRRAREGGMFSVGIVTARGTPNTVNPCSRNFVTNNFICASNRVPIGPTSNAIPRNVTTRARRDYGGINTVLRTTNSNCSGIVGAAYFLTSVTSFTTFGRICTGCFASGPTHDYITIGSLPGNILYRVRTITRTWTPRLRQLYILPFAAL